uniref:Uncharacterized protein n=1 Tax=Streptomyces sp. NBC_00003 TaxID=2903608 RepID=A0AAU2VHD4_9ACTN
MDPHLDGLGRDLVRVDEGAGDALDQFALELDVAGTLLNGEAIGSAGPDQEADRDRSDQLS